MAPYFDKPFKLVIDASDTGVGSVLVHEDEKVVTTPEFLFQETE